MEKEDPKTQPEPEVGPLDESVEESVCDCDAAYIKTPQGIAKVTAMACDALFFICIACTRYYWHDQPTGIYAFFVCITAFIFNSTILSFHLCHVWDRCRGAIRLAIELLFSSIWCLFYLATAIDTAVRCNEASWEYHYYTTYWSAVSYVREPGLAAAAFFGFVSVVVYGVDIFLKCTNKRKSHPEDYKSNSMSVEV